MMRVYLPLLILCLACLGCADDFKEYELEEASFGADTMAQIEEESGIDLPDGSKGLKYHYVPPIDPIVFAKIAIPSGKKKAMESQLAGLASCNDGFPTDFANDMCKWWPASPANVVASKEAFSNGYYIEAYLVRENGQLVLYLKYFTI